MIDIASHLNTLDIGLISTIGTLIFYVLRLRIAPLTNAEKAIVTRLLIALGIGVLNILSRSHKPHMEHITKLSEDFKLLKAKVLPKKEVG